MCERAVGEMSPSSLLGCDGDETWWASACFQGRASLGRRDEICILRCSCLSCYIGERLESISSLDSTSFKRNCGWWDPQMSLNGGEASRGPQWLCLKKKGPSSCSVPWLPCGRFRHTWRSSPGVDGDFSFWWGPFKKSFGEGNGNPLQCSCLKNPRDGGAWWAAIYGVSQESDMTKAT